MAPLLALTFLLALSTVSCAPEVPLKYADLDPYKLQWNVTFALTGTPNKTKFIMHNCTEKNLGKACNKPAMSPDNKDKIQINITLKNTTSVNNFQTYKGLKPIKVAVKLCYSETSSMDRPWRKANKIIKKDKACPITVKTVPFMGNGSFNNHTFVYNFSVKTDIAKAVWYVRVLVKCDDGTVDGKWCQYDGTKAKNYFETNTIEQVTPALRTCIIILSIAGPLFMVAYMVIDSIRRKNK